MPKIQPPPIVLPEHIRAINLHLRSRRRHHYALYIELIAYPDMKASDLINATLRDIDLKRNTVCGIEILPISMKRVLKHVKNNGLKKPSHEVFDFTRQAVQAVWKKTIVACKMSRRCTIRDLKLSFNSYLRTHHGNYGEHEDNNA